MKSNDRVRLTATFEISLPSYLFIFRPEEDELTYITKIDNFDVEIKMISGGGWKCQFKGEPYSTFGVVAISISASRNEYEEPPPHLSSPVEVKEQYSRESYYRKRLPLYQNVVREATERFILFFNYWLHQPHLHFDIHPNELVNPIWTDNTGKIHKLKIRTFISEKPDGLQSELGEKRFTKDDDKNLLKCLGERYQPNLAEEFLSDSRNSYYKNNLRRAILELAIACEILVKRYFFGSNSVASGVFEYDEDKSRIVGRVIDLIGPSAKRAFGISFKEDKEEDYKNIDNLFRCRNKIAHIGELIYRDDSGITHKGEKGDFKKWWHSVEQLRNWLDRFGEGE
jgi:hypothetical protein